VQRSAALAPLSRDHHLALTAALRLRRADADTVGAAIKRFRSFFETTGEQHLDTEEEVILPAIPADDLEWATGVERVLDDHAVIRARAAALDRAPSRVVAARALGERLQAHVRFEERVLFEMLERRLTPSELERLGAAVTHAELAAGQRSCSSDTS
jgi:hemerythrin-like domain-containing protein